MNQDATTETPQESAAYRQARRQVRALRGWYRHAFIYAVVIGALWIWHGISPSMSAHAHNWAWPLAPTLGWGLGLAIHGLSVWSRVGARGRQWEERKIRQLMQRG